MAKGFRYLIVLACLLACCTLSALAQQARYGDAAVQAEGFAAPGHLSDGSRATYTTASGPARVTLSRAEGMAALYMEFDRVPSPWTLTDPATGASLACGENGFLHEFVDLSSLGDGLPRELVLGFEEGTAVAELYAFSDGELPDWVQIWQPPCQEADLLLISSHSDDEQLFFAGVLPYYAVERQLSVQVAYVVQHFQAYGTADHQRPHEQLDGLWTVGVRHYPVMSEFPDLYSESKDRAAALEQALSVYGGAGYEYDDFVDYLTGCIRRFRPLVVVSHDLNGEYGHGTHVLCAAALTDALTRAADPAQDPDTAGAYGAWTVEKTYLHLYPENQIVMDWDTPLDSLGGKTPFQVTQEGFGCHKSQHWTWFNRWLYGTDASPIGRAAEITSYSPCLHGLYDTQVGPDSAGGDFFEHVQTYAQRAQAALEEERERAEAQRLEEERLAQEAAEAQREAQEQERQEAEAEKQALRAAQARTWAWIGGAVLAAVGCALLIAYLERRRGGR